MTYADLQAEAQRQHLTVLGGFYPEKDEEGLQDYRTVLMLGPDGSQFWPQFIQSAEFLDGTPDPVDRWSKRIISEMATSFGAAPHFPFGSQPYMPFYQWALRTKSVHRSPIRLLVHREHGLFVSFRGAIAFPDRISLPAPLPSPCHTCTDKPCLTACPVEALGDHDYAVEGCREFIRAPRGMACLDQGCAVRRACPASNTSGRLPAQSAYHMSEFLRNEP